MRRKCKSRDNLRTNDIAGASAKKAYERNVPAPTYKAEKRWATARSTDPLNPRYVVHD